MAWKAGYAKRRKITIDSGDITAGLSWFPVLVYLGQVVGRGPDDLRSIITFVDDGVGGDPKDRVLFTKADGTTELYAEIEKWDTTGGSEKAWFWVSRTGWSIASGADTDFYIYYNDGDVVGNDTWTNYTGTGAGEAVWDANFQAVYHLSQVDGNTPTPLDSTSGDKDLTSHNTEAVDFGVTDGKHFCVTPDGINEYFDRAAFSLNGEAEGSLEVWFKTSTDARHYIVSMPDDTTGNNGLDLEIRTDVNGVRSILVGTQGASILTHNCTPWDGSWHHLASKFEDNVGGEMYYDGTPVDSDANYDGIAKCTDNELNVARFGTLGIYTIASLDEVRISDIARSDAYFKATYEAGRDNLLDFGSEETIGVYPTRILKGRGGDARSRVGFSHTLKLKKA